MALKILPAKALSDDDARKQLRQEALAVGKLNHSNIATAFYFGEENGVDFLVTEYISGTGLDEMVKHGPLPEETVLALGVQLASGLEAAHREGIIHRDLKPGNLRITEDGQLKILDFGLAELVDPGIDVASAETVTLTMTLTGTLPYMAPEQFDGLCDQRSDLWAAGVVRYEMATGQRPFPEAKLQRLKDAILHREPARPAALNPAISQGLESVILRALQKDPKRRYQTAKDLREDLARVAAGQDVKRDSWLRGNSAKLAVAAVLIGILVYATHRFWPQGTGPQQASYRVLAVLPIETGSRDPSEIALGRGVAETVSARIAQGTTFFANNRWGIELAQTIVDAVPCAQQVRFVSSGSEADLYAMRAARAYTKRDKILKFEGGYHGMSDYSLMSLAPRRTSNFPGAIPDSGGIPRSVRDEMLIAPFNNVDAVTSLIQEHRDELAGVIVEPFQRIIPPAPGFLQALRRVTAENGVPLRAAVYAQGASSPVLEIAVTDVSYGAVSAGDVEVAPPAGAKVVQLDSAGHASNPAGDNGAPVTGLAAVQAAAGFPVAPKLARFGGVQYPAIRGIYS